jgi:hypothetical protein
VVVLVLPQFLYGTKSMWDKINDTKADIQKVESTVQEAKFKIPR